MNMTVGNTFFKKRANQLTTYESGPSRTQVDYIYWLYRLYILGLRLKELFERDQSLRVHHPA